MTKSTLAKVIHQPDFYGSGQRPGHSSATAQLDATLRKLCVVLLKRWQRHVRVIEQVTWANGPNVAAYGADPARRENL
ncbi:hypothetical protein Cob_v006099 [Colletotrichum orbiculare MAFF 240422]|uniref:Uncharacterized protein n=1 Tax=Colletotrichum orbiculare (strain 104-T / ATCC 96160 / CBS 514.97 / LARS 414 / MAFF 240422) TaxID=1213857 RepID=A0A484FRD5_COLOR|nr:hypothetical protein Cob_v006099 [Colletotrichum orbiculare MAFF 240422]